MIWWKTSGNAITPSSGNALRSVAASLFFLCIGVEMKSSRTPKSIQRAQREETRKERHSVRDALKKYRYAEAYNADAETLQRLKVRHERE